MQKVSNVSDKSDRGGNFLPIAIPIVLLLLWEVSVSLGWVRSVILPSPSEIGSTLVSLVSTGELLHNLFVSVIRVAKGFAIGMTLGVLLGIQTAFSPLFYQSTKLIFGILRPIPVIAWIPVMILWLGIDEASKVAIISIGSFWAVFVSVVQAIRHVDRKYIEVASVLGKDRKTIVWKVVLPAALPEIFTGVRIGIDVAWRSVIAAEMIAASAGVGYMIMYARELSQTDTVLVGMLAIGLTGSAIEFLVRRIERRFLHWKLDTSQEGGAAV